VLEGAAWAADPLDQARTAVAASDYTAARPALTAALEGGGRGPDELVEIYRLTGIVQAALGDTKAATDAFTRLLALSPKAVLPDGTSPKIKRPFDAAARYAQSHPALEVKLETLARPPMITLVVVSDPLHLVATARAAFVVDGAAEASKDAGVTTARTQIPLPPGRRIDTRLTALDAYGNRLVEIGSREVPVVILSDPPAPPPAPPRPVIVRAPPPPIYRRWWPYAAVGGAALGATIYAGLVARSRADDLQRIHDDAAHHTAGEAAAAEDRARSAVLWTNIGLGVTAAFAVAAGAMYLTAPRDRIETRVAAVPVPGGGALILGGSF
jgi:hypothetical protein